MHAASDGLIIGISVVGVIIIMVCFLNMVIAGGIKINSEATVLLIKSLDSKRIISKHSIAIIIL